MLIKWRNLERVNKGLNCQLFWSVIGLAVAASGHGSTNSSFSVFDFDYQVQHLLDNEMLTPLEIANLSMVFKDLEQTLRDRWPDSEVIPLGSFVTGLASKSSDADCMVKIPKYDVTSDRYLIMETARLLKRHPEVYNGVKTKVDKNRRIPLLKFNYTPTKRNCDVNFIRNTALHNSHMMGYYFSINNKFLSLAAILKIWSKVNNLRSTDTLASNTLNLLIIFYLQQLKIAPPFNLLQRHLVQCPIGDWETRFKRILPYNITVEVSLYRLLGGFFKYYNEFNFDECVVSPFLGRVILKKDFEDVNRLPEELSLYKRYLRKEKSKALVVNTKICVQDAIELRRNTADVPLYKANNFISHVRFAAKMFEVLPKDLFLQVILGYQVDI